MLDRGCPRCGLLRMAARVTLHEAMAEVLRRHGAGWMERDEIAEVIAREGLFLRPSDGQPPPSDQLRLRAHKYPQIFACSDTACTRIRLRTAQSCQGPEGALATTQEQSIQADWHTARRRKSSARKYQPERIRMLLVAEAPPAALDRYFYFQDVTVQDSLFRYVVRSVLGKEPTRVTKSALLQELHDQGVFLIDLKDDPSDGRALASHVPDLVTRVTALAPDSVILIKATVYDAAFEALQSQSLPVIDERIPFPGSGRQRQFEEAMARALRRASFH